MQQLSRPAQGIPARLSLALAAALLLAASPAASLAQDDPETPVLAFMAALEEKRLEDAATLFCPAFALAPEDLDLGAAMIDSLPEGIDPQLAVDAIVVDFTGPGGAGEPSVAMASEEADGSVTLQVDTELRVSIDAENAEGFIRAIVESMLAAEGTEATDDLIDAMVDMVGAQAAESFQFSQTLSGPVTVTPTEAGGWVICSAILDMGETPAASGVPTATDAPSDAG